MALDLPVSAGLENMDKRIVINKSARFVKTFK
jgi:hypothetical protein